MDIEALKLAISEKNQEYQEIESMLFNYTR